MPLSKNSINSIIRQSADQSFQLFKKEPGFIEATLNTILGKPLLKDTDEEAAYMHLLTKGNEIVQAPDNRPESITIIQYYTKLYLLLNLYEYSASKDYQQELSADWLLTATSAIMQAYQALPESEKSRERFLRLHAKSGLLRQYPNLTTNLLYYFFLPMIVLKQTLYLSNLYYEFFSNYYTHGCTVYGTYSDLLDRLQPILLRSKLPNPGRLAYTPEEEHYFFCLEFLNNFLSSLHENLVLCANFFFFMIIVYGIYKLVFPPHEKSSYPLSDESCFAYGLFSDPLKPLVNSEIMDALQKSYELACSENTTEDAPRLTQM